jgi:hypothetical protein
MTRSLVARQWVGSIGENPISRPEVGISTSNGRAYYTITSLLKKGGIPFVDIVDRNGERIDNTGGATGQILSEGNVRLIITTRRERVQYYDSNVLCIEDLGDDAGIAREKILPYLYPTKSTDWFVVGIDPGKRSGVAAFMNHWEVESSVIQSFEGTIARVCALIDNAPSVRKVVKIGSGNASLARRIAEILEARYRGKVRIQLVNESGTSSLTRRRSRARGRFETRDQRAAKMIAFRDGFDYLPES